MIALEDFIKATNGQLVGPAPVNHFSDFAFDSRIVEPGQLFLALVTETGDGHRYIEEACSAGAKGVVCQTLPQKLRPNVTYIQVENTQQALIDYARYIFSHSPLEVIGITGSVGKTSTKEAIAAVLSERFAVFKNYGNYNGRFGLPIALGKLERNHRLAVLEMACDSHGEIRLLAEISKPRIGLVTSIGHSHIAFFGSLEELAKEKGYLIEALPPSPQGIAILNYDDPLVRRMAARTRATVLTYGLSPEADLYANKIKVSAKGTQLVIHWQGQSFSVFIPFIGAHHAYTALAAVAVGITYGLSWEEIRQGLAQVEPLPGRTRLLEGINGCQLLDDSYNACPESSLAALQTLQSLPAKRRLIVLGDMVQLGSYTEEAHRFIGKQCAHVGDLLITKGELAHIAADEARREGLAPERIRTSYTAADVVRFLQKETRPGDLVLLKGSAEARLEMVARELLADPATAPQVLPRQHRGWQRVRLVRPERPTWVEIDLEAIAQNVRRIVEWVGPEVKVLAVLKADGYGHGAIKVARTALNNGATWLGVACLSEAIALRQAGISAPILILGFTPPWQARETVLHEVTATIFSLDVAQALSRAALDLGRQAHVHIKVDTGMGRLGLLPDEVVSFATQVASLPGIDLDGIFTHFSSADEADLSYTLWQIERFNRVLGALRAQGIIPRHIHAANSAAILRLPQSHYNMVRLGLLMYGLSPSPEVPCPPGFRPALSFKCQVAQVKELPVGSYIGYGRAFRTTRPSRIAVIPVGYADGFRRGPRNWGEVLVRGQRAPIVGRVCMDQTMIDVTDIPGVQQGDEVVLIGSQGEERITVDDVAKRLGTINYEVISEILARVPRVV